MKLRQLEYLKELSETKNFSKAAENLYIAQSTLSQQIALLEDELGTQLFKRSSKYVELTTAGQFVLECANNIFNEVDKINSNIIKYSTKKDSLRIGVIWSMNYLGISKGLRDFINTRKDINVVITPDSSMNIRKNLSNHKYDVGITIVDENDVPENIKIVKKIDDIFIIVGMPKNHPLSAKKTINIKDLANYPIITMGPESIFYDYISHNLTDNNFNVVCSCPSFDTACEMVRGDIGLCIAGLTEEKTNKENNGVVFKKIKDLNNHQYSFAFIVSEDRYNKNISELITDISKSI